MINKILNFIKHAGQNLIDIRKEKGLYIDFKEKSPVGMVTEADINISFLFKDFIDNNFSDLNYFIVDEESISNYKNDIFEKIENAEYVFVPSVHEVIFIPSMYATGNTFASDNSNTVITSAVVFSSVNIPAYAAGKATISSIAM